MAQIAHTSRAHALASASKMATTSAARRLFGPAARLGFGAARLLRPPSTLRFLSALASRAVPRGEWSELVKKMDESAKHEEKIAHTHVAEQADIEARTSELSAELGELQLSRRMESHLCRSYILGRTSGLTAEDVAQVMARMCYLHEHDEEFLPKLKSVDETVDAAMREIARTRRTRVFSGFYRGIRADACEVAYGHSCRSVVEIKRHITGHWDKWPERWPWIESE